MIHSSGKHLTLYQTIPTEMTLEKVAFWKHCRKRRKCWSPAFSPFSTMFLLFPHFFQFLSYIFSVVCKCFQFGQVQNFVIWQRIVLDKDLSHNNPCFPCSIPITNFLVKNKCEVRFHDVINCTVHVFTSWCHPTEKFQNKAKWVCFGPLFFNLIRWIQLCDKKNLTFIDRFDKILLNSSWLTLPRLPKAHLKIFSRLV